jgi:hypothetical protein
MNIFKKITELTLLIKKDIENNKPYHNAIFHGVNKAFCNIPQNSKNIIMMRICDNLERKVIS